MKRYNFLFDVYDTPNNNHTKVWEPTVYKVWANFFFAFIFSNFKTIRKLYKILTCKISQLNFPMEKFWSS